MKSSAINRYRVRPSWGLLGAAIIGLLWGAKAASLVVEHFGTLIESVSGQPGLWTVGIAVAALISVSLGMLIDWAYWSDEVPAVKTLGQDRITAE